MMINDRLIRFSMHIRQVKAAIVSLLAWLLCLAVCLGSFFLAIASATSSFWLAMISISSLFATLLASVPALTLTSTAITAIAFEQAYQRFIIPLLFTSPSALPSTPPAHDDSSHAATSSKTGGDHGADPSKRFKQYNNDGDDENDDGLKMGEVQKVELLSQPDPQPSQPDPRPTLPPLPHPFHHNDENDKLAAELDRKLDEYKSITEKEIVKEGTMDEVTKEGKEMEDEEAMDYFLSREKLNSADQDVEESSNSNNDDCRRVTMENDEDGHDLDDEDDEEDAFGLGGELLGGGLPSACASPLFPSSSTSSLQALSSSLPRTNNPPSPSPLPPLPTPLKNTPYLTNNNSSASSSSFSTPPQQRKALAAQSVPSSPFSSSEAAVLPAELLPVAVHASPAGEPSAYPMGHMMGLRKSSAGKSKIPRFSLSQGQASISGEQGIDEVDQRQQDERKAAARIIDHNKISPTPSTFTQPSSSSTPSPLTVAAGTASNPKALSSFLSSSSSTSVSSSCLSAAVVVASPAASLSVSPAPGPGPGPGPGPARIQKETVAKGQGTKRKN